MPFMIPAAAGASAIGTAALGGAAIGAGALGTGIAAGVGLAGGLPGLLGGMGALGGAGTAGSVLGGTALTPAVASLAPAATAQAMGPTLLQASLPGMQGGMGALAPGVTSGATSGLAGAANPALASQYAAAQQQAALAKQNLLAQSGGQNIVGGAAQQTPNLTGQMQAAQLKSAGSAPLPADTAGMSGVMPGQNFMQNLGSLMQNPSMQGVKDYAAEHPYATSAAVGLGTKGLMSAMQQKKPPTPENNAMIRPYDFDYSATGAAYQPGGSTSEQLYFNPTYTAGEPYKATKKAEGGIASAYAVGGPVEQMSAMNAVGANTGYPMANINTPMYANPMMQRPEAMNVIAPSADAGVGAYSGEARFSMGGPTTTKQNIMGPTVMRTTPSGTATGEVWMSSRPAILDSGSGPFMSPELLAQHDRQFGITRNLPTVPAYTYNPNTIQFTDTATGKVSGGGSTPGAPSNTASSVPIAQTPAYAPAQAPAYSALNIPAYQSPEQQLGLDPFYVLMGQQLAGYGGYAKGGNVGGEVGTYSGEARFAAGGQTLSGSVPSQQSVIMGPTIMRTAPGTGQLMGGTVQRDNPLPNTGSVGILESFYLNYPDKRPITPKAASTLGRYTFDPNTIQFTDTATGEVSGGGSTPGAPSNTASSVPTAQTPAYQSPEQQLGLDPFYALMGQQLAGYGGFAAGGGVGGEPNLGGYSDGGRLLKGPGDGVSDSIPAVIGKRQPARLADGEFVVPARIVSELGNGSTEAGARKLYAMMDRVQKGRRKSVGKGKVAVNSKADKHLPA